MKKIVSILLSFILIFSVVSISITTYAEEFIEDKSINNFINGIVELSHEYDADKDFVVVDDTSANSATINQFYSNSESLETDEDNLLDFQTARLIVRADGTFNTYGAVEHVQGFKDFHILQYENPTLAETAYTALKISKEIISVYPDAVVYNVTQNNTTVLNETNSIDATTHLCNWSLDRTQSKRLQDYLSESNARMEEVTVGIVDTGVDYNHEFLQGRIKRTYFNAGSDGLPNDEMDSFDTNLCHGTAVSSVIVDNSPENVKIAAYKVLNEDDSSTPAVISAGLLEAISDDVDAINMSMGFPDESGLTQEVLRLAYSKNIPVITALGNYAMIDPYDVACIDENIVVAASDKNNIVVLWNNYSPYVDIVAPGEDINVTIYGNSYDLWLGTSFSAPCVTALVAIMKSFDNDLTVDEVEQKIENSSVDVFNALGYGSSYQGNRLVQFCNAMNLPKLASPEMSLSTRAYEGTQICTITCKDDSATILYTTDGTYPDISTAKVYSFPIEINEYTQLRTVAYYKETGYYSDEVKADIRICFLGDEDDFTIDENGVVTSYNGEIADLIVPEYINGIQVTDIGKDAFTTETLIGITLPESVIQISDGEKFKGNNTIKYISGNGVTTIGHSVFKSMSALMYADFPNLEAMGGSAFAYNSTLISLHFPKLKEIGNSAFMYSKILEFSGPEVVIVGQQAFSHCNGFTKIYLPKAEKISSIRGSVFTESSTGEVYMPHLKSIPIKFCYETLITSANFPNAESIKSSSFQSCEYLKYINLPNISEVPENAFISNKHVGDTITMREYYLDSVLTIGQNAFGTQSTKRVEFSNLESTSSLPQTEGCIIAMPSTFTECTEDTKGRNYIIYGTSGTYAETWASENGHTFIEVSQDTAILEDLPTEYYGLGEILSPDVIGFNKTYQWYSNTEPNNTTGTPIEGATSKDFNPADYPEARYYYCVITSTDNGYDPIEIRTGITENKTIHIHTEEEIPAVAPSCTETGLTAGVKCSECGEIITAQQELPALGHDYKSVVVAPTCTEDGYTTYTCSVCNDSYVSDHTDALGHSYTSEITTPATHTATGVMTYTCTCGDTYTEIVEKTSDHNHEAVITTPTCTEQGYTTYTCECGDNYVDDYVNATGHADNDNNGYCDICSETVEVETPSDYCDCGCHQTGIKKIIYVIVLFFQRLFGLNKTCGCGVIHY